MATQHIESYPWQPMAEQAPPNDSWLIVCWASEAALFPFCLDSSITNLNAASSVQLWKRGGQARWKVIICLSVLCWVTGRLPCQFTWGFVWRLEKRRLHLGCTCCGFKANRHISFWVSLFLLINFCRGSPSYWRVQVDFEEILNQCAWFDQHALHKSRGPHVNPMFSSLNFN